MRRKNGVFIAIIAVCLAFSGCSSNKTVKTSSVIDTNKISYKSFYGSVASSDNKVYFSDTNAKIDDIKVQVGDLVNKDAELLDYTEIINNSTDGNNNKKTTFKCDFDKGVVTDVSIVKGQTVTNGTKLITLCDKSKYYIKAEVVENLISDIKIGKEVTIIPTADKSKKYKGTITKIDSCAHQKENGDTVVGINVSVSNIDDFLCLGYNVEVRCE